MRTHHCQGGLASCGATGAPGVGGSGLVLTQRQLGLQRQPHQPAQQQPQQQQPLAQQAVAARTVTQLQSDNPARLQLQKLPSESKVGAAGKEPELILQHTCSDDSAQRGAVGDSAATDVIITVDSCDPESRGCRDGIDEDVPKDFGIVWDVLWGAGG